MSVACGEQRGLSGGAHPMSSWGTTERGDIFIHEPECIQTAEDGQAARMCVFLTKRIPCVIQHKCM